MNNKKFDYSVSIIRILATSFILICHLLPQNLSWATQFFNVGVYIFLLISGFLYGNKKIKSFPYWLYSRFLKIFIPVIITAIFVALITNIFVDIDILPLFTYAFNLQGLNFLQGYFSLPFYHGLAHLWFVTVIMICYLLTIALKHFEEKTPSTKSIAVLIIISLVTISIVSSFLKIYIYYFIAYFTGYFFAKYLHKFTIKSCIFITLITIFSVAIRLITKNHFDNTVLYSHIIIPITHTTIAIWFFYLIKTLNFLKENTIKTIENNKLISHFDKLSYYIYITHYIFCVGPFSIYAFIQNYFIATAVILLISALLGELLLYISNKINYILLSPTKNI